MKKIYDKKENDLLEEAIQGSEAGVVPGAMKNRVGHFAITTNGGDIFDNPQQRHELKLIMESVIIIQATHISSLDQIAYVALSEQFEVVEPGGNVGGYLPTFELDKDGNYIACKWETHEDYMKLNCGENN